MSGLRFKWLVSKCGSDVIYFEDNVFYYGYDTAERLAVWRCKGFKTYACDRQIEIDAECGTIEFVYGDHAAHASTYDPMQYRWNKLRNELMRGVGLMSTHDGRSTHDYFNDYRREHIDDPGAIPTFRHVKSSLARVRQRKQGKEPITATDLKLKEKGLIGNIYSRMLPQSKYRKFSQRFVHQLQEDPNIYCSHSYAQTCICKGANHVFLDGSFKSVPHINGNHHIWAQVFSIMVARCDDPTGAAHGYLGMFCSYAFDFLVFVGGMFWVF